MIISRASEKRTGMRMRNVTSFLATWAAQMPDDFWGQGHRYTHILYDTFGHPVQICLQQAGTMLSQLQPGFTVTNVLQALTPKLYRPTLWPLLTGTCPHVPKACPLPPTWSGLALSAFTKCCSVQS